jgi:hypothetical protein
MAKSNAGVDSIAAMIGNPLGFSGTASATSATSLTSTGFTASAYIGQMVVAGTVYGVITANSTTVLTVERWVNPATPGGAAGSTPGSTSTFSIVPGQAPAAFMALTANSSAASPSNTSLTGEITTAGGGLIRKLCSFAHTAGTSTYTEGATFTANGSDSLPVTAAKVGVFPTLTGATGILVWETLLSATAAFAAIGDAATVTQTVTIT